MTDLSVDRIINEGNTLDQLSDSQIEEMVRSTLKINQIDRQENQLELYQPASPRAAKIHTSTARIIGVGGGNGSSKTETCLVEIIALATGILPRSQRDHLLPKFRGPVNCRIVVESITTTLENIILPKLQYWKWTGVDEQGGERGHWGWVPKSCLKDGSWEKSYHAKLRTLTVLCRDPENPDRILGESSIQFMSHEQDSSDFASGDYHHVMMDEPPRFAIWRECEARTMRVGGRLYLAMTWPDDPTIPVEWIFDQVYEKGQEGPNKVSDIDWFELWTIENTNLNQEAIARQMEQWDEQTKQVRIFGRNLRFSHRIHPLFTDVPTWWSFPAGKVVFPSGDLRCPETGSPDIVEFCHVQQVEVSTTFPTIFLLDPHPRKPHMFMWAQIDGNDDITIIADGELDASPEDLRSYVFDFESTYNLRIVDRMIDPNMGRSPSSATQRRMTWQEEFSQVGLNCALASDSDVGRSRINEYLRPDPSTMRPRIVLSEHCFRTVAQMKRYVWDNFRRQDEKALKEKPKAKNDDYPTMLKYLLNSAPCFSVLQQGAPIIRSNRGYQSRTSVRTH